MIGALSLAFALYALLLFSIGFYGYRQLRSSADFMLGSRRINYWVTAISAQASDMSSWLFFAFPAAIYTNGLVEGWAAVGLIIGCWATWHFVAPQLRIKTEKTNSNTLAHFLTATSGDQSGIVALIAASAALFFFVFYIASGLQGIGMLLHATFGVSPTIAIVVSALAIMAYTMLGGYVAIALTDAFQGIFLLVMILLVPLVVWLKLPLETVPSLSALPALQATTVGHAILIAINWGIGYCGMPHVLSKFMGLDEVKNMKKAQYIGLSWQILALGAAAAIGILGRIVYAGKELGTTPLFTSLVMSHFSPFFAGLVLCAILAASISTLDSQLMVSATILTQDICNPHGARRQMLVTRLSIVLLTILGIWIALTSSKTLYDIVNYAWSGLGSTFGPVVLASLYVRSLTPAGVVAGMLSGATGAALSPYLGSMFAGIPMIPGFTCGLVATVLISRITRR